MAHQRLTRGAILLTLVSLLQFLSFTTAYHGAPHRHIQRSHVMERAGVQNSNHDLAYYRKVVKDAQDRCKKRNQKIIESRVKMYIPGQNSNQVGAMSVEGDDSIITDEVKNACKTVAEEEAKLKKRDENLGGLNAETEKRQAPGFWMEDVEHGKAVYGGSDYVFFRNVKDYGAIGDGVTDDTDAINKAIADQDRCGPNCRSSTRKPAIIYFPSGTYLVSGSLQLYYNTQMIGNPNSKPIIKAASSFVGLGVISTNPYLNGPFNGQPWYLAANNFLRQIRNFVVDIQDVPDIYPAGIHWVIAQGTSLQNIEFLQSTGNTTNHQGIFMENGSGGFISDLTFRGGAFGMYVGNQQFTSRNLKFVGCRTAIQVHWNWQWTFKNLDITKAEVGVRIVNWDDHQTGAVLLLDSKVSYTDTAVLVSQPVDNRGQQIPTTHVTLDNLKLYAVPNAVKIDGGATILAGTGKTIKFIPSWGIGRRYTNSTGTGQFSMGSNITPLRTISSGLLGGPDSSIFTRSKPQYESFPASQFISVKANGAKGDGTTDDTAAINAVLAEQAGTGNIVYFPHGVYIVTRTVFVPVGTRIVGEGWPQLMGKGAYFMDMKTPRPIVKVGNSGDSGMVEISDMLFTVRGATAGAVLVQWNVKQSTKGSAAMWDSHFRVGGAYGSSLQAKNCPKLTAPIENSCLAGSLLLHLTSSSSAYLENIWAWVADHDLDIPEESQIDVYVARGILIESKGPTWMYGTASEHCIMYQYQASNAKDLFMGMIQTESPYYQPAPKAPAPMINSVGKFSNDPRFTDCSSSSVTCPLAWGLRLINSANVYVYGTGLYSWFSNYTQTCLQTESCQDELVSVDTLSKGVWIYNHVTKAAVNMIKRGSLEIPSSDNDYGFASTIGAWLLSSGKV